RRDRRLLPPRHQERSGGQLPAWPRLRESREPGRRPRSVGADGGSLDEALLMSGAAFVRVERRGRAAWVTLDRPPLNLILPEMIDGLIDTFAEVRRDRELQAIVLPGAGRATTAGMQLQFLQRLTVAQAKAFITTLHQAIHSVHEAPVPTICMINGPCLGGGFE